MREFTLSYSVLGRAFRRLGTFNFHMQELTGIYVHLVYICTFIKFFICTSTHCLYTFIRFFICMQGTVPRIPFILFIYLLRTKII
jgi:hypothetical protein